MYETIPPAPAKEPDTSTSKQSTEMHTHTHTSLAIWRNAIKTAKTLLSHFLIFTVLLGHFIASKLPAGLSYGYGDGVARCHISFSTLESLGGAHKRLAIYTQGRTKKVTKRNKTKIKERNLVDLVCSPADGVWCMVCISVCMSACLCLIVPLNTGFSLTYI